MSFAKLTGQPRRCGLPLSSDMGSSNAGAGALNLSGNATFAPRWSPDGTQILYSMATGGNTDIYRISANGGTPVRLTNNPGIDVGGSFSISRKIDVTAGVRYASENDRVIPLADNRKDSEAVYVGTKIRF